MYYTAMRRLVAFIDLYACRLSGERMQSMVRVIFAWIAVVSYVVALLLVFLTNRGISIGFSHLVPPSYLSAIAAPLTVLLVYELYLLVLAFKKSIVDFLQKQFEIVALLIVRDLFKYVGQAGDTLFTITATNVAMALALVGVLVVYGLIEFLERFEARYATEELSQESSLVTKGKSALSLMLLVWLAGVTIYYLWGGLLGFAGSGLTKPYFGTVFTILLIADIFILLLTLVSKDKFSHVFEYSLFTLASVALRLALPLSTLEKTIVTAAAVLLTMVVIYLHRFVREDEIENKPIT
jgi:uncharacterized membrane protein (DUF373 family)